MGIHATANMPTKGITFSPDHSAIHCKVLTLCSFAQFLSVMPVILSRADVALHGLHLLTSTEVDVHTNAIVLLLTISHETINYSV